MARKRASMREGPLAEVGKATEAAQKQGGREPPDEPAPVSSEPLEPLEETVPHVPEWEAPAPPPPRYRAEQRESPPPAPLREAPPLREEEPPAPPEPRYTPPASRWIDPLPESPARLERVPRGESGTYLAVIRVVGVGGAGLNAIDRMMDAGVSQVEFIAVNTDIQQLQMSDAPLKIHIGRELTS